LQELPAVLLTSEMKEGTLWQKYKPELYSWHRKQGISVAATLRLLNSSTGIAYEGYHEIVDAWRYEFDTNVPADQDIHDDLHNYAMNVLSRIPSDSLDLAALRASQVNWVNYAAALDGHAISFYLYCGLIDIIAGDAQLYDLEKDPQRMDVYSDLFKKVLQGQTHLNIVEIDKLINNMAIRRVRPAVHDKGDAMFAQAAGGGGFFGTPEPEEKKEEEDPTGSDQILDYWKLQVEIPLRRSKTLSKWVMDDEWFVNVDPKFQTTAGNISNFAKHFHSTILSDGSNSKGIDSFKTQGRKMGVTTIQKHIKNRIHMVIRYGPNNYRWEKPSLLAPTSPTKHAQTMDNE